MTMSRSFIVQAVAALGLLFAPATFNGAAAQTATAPATFTLSNGLHVVVIPDRRTPVVTQMIWYKVGSADETPGKSGLAHFLEHLMFKGTAAHPAGERFRDLAVAVPGGHSVPGEAVPVERRLNRAHVEAELAERGLVLRLAEDGDVAREEPLRRLVEVILVTMCHEHRVEAANDRLGRERKLDGRVANRVRGARDRRPRACRIEHRIDEDPRAGVLQHDRCIAHERDLHAWISRTFAA